MSIFDTLAKTFGPKAKAPSLDALERAEGEADAAVTAARAALEALEGERANAVVQGEAARAAFRSKLTAARDDLEDAEAALAAVRDRLQAARQEAVEREKRARYDAAVAAQTAAQGALRESYTAAIETLRTLQRKVADADELARIANADLPQGAARLLETEAVRDVPATPERIVSTETADMWFAVESGAPVDAAQVTRREGRRGTLYAPSALGPRPVTCELRPVRKVVRQPWCPPAYAARIGDLELPALMADPVPPAAPVTEFAPITPPAIAAE